MVKAANLFVAAFLLPKDGTVNADGTVNYKYQVPTTSNLLAVLTGAFAYEQPSDEMLATAEKVCRDSRVLHWTLVFPTVFAHGGFDCVLGNPPWDRIKLQEKEFFAARDPNIANALNAAVRKKLIDELPTTNPALFESFQAAKRRAETASQFVHDSGRFTLSNVGDVNLYSIIAETNLHIRNEKGRAGFIVPSGICTDDSNKQLFSAMVNAHQLSSFLSFENEERLFPDVHHSFKFALITIGHAEVADFSFFNRQVTSLADERRHFSLSSDDFILINPNTLTAPIFRSKADAELAKKIYRRVGVLWNETRVDGNPWGLRFRRLFDMSNDSDLFETQPREGTLPLYEAKMIHQFDHRWATYEQSQDDARDVLLDEKRDPAFEVCPRYWVNVEAVLDKFDGASPKYLMGWRDITNAIAVRTDIASVSPFSATGDTLLLFETMKGGQLDACLLADMNSYVHDWCARQKVGGVHLKYFTKKQLPSVSPDAYTQSDIDFIVPRVLELTYTSSSLKPWAEALGYNGEPFKFDPERRAILRAELDARYAKLYGLNEEELTYILDPSAVYGPDYPSESFRVLKEKEIAEFGEYRTMRLVLEAFRKDER